MLFENVICFDHLTQHIVLITNIPTENLDESYQQGLRTLDEMEHLVFQQPTQPVEPLQLHGPSPRHGPRQVHGHSGTRQTLHPRRGHLPGGACQPAAGPRQWLPLRRLPGDAHHQPVPLHVLLHQPGGEIAGASPETLVSVQDGVAKTFPLAGTPRGATAEEDAALENELLHDPKELAEHYMLVDLGRNDLGRFAAPAP
ncbi:MAG: chorismate-binding protein [Lawsonella clevelandensis]